MCFNMRGGGMRGSLCWMNTGINLVQRFEVLNQASVLQVQFVHLVLINI